ncbi:MAG: T9SS type A sorting domain-containing protein [Cyclobacteriaceae bacterium]|nr:T9SS type A sorting domain-containing protein [Cyclobacteriaceae bacterium]
MKTFFYISLFTLVSSFAWSQSLKIVDSNLHVDSEVGTSTSTTIKVQNISNHTIMLGIEKIEENIRSSQLSAFCINNDCSKKNIVSSNAIIKLLPGQIFEGFSTTLETGLVPGNSSVTFLIYNLSNTNESIEAEINYFIKEKAKEGLLYASDVVELSDVFPNPATEKAIFNYNYLDPEKEAKLVIHSVLGSIISEYKLSPYETRLSIPVISYNPGVYFYTLYIENEGVATKKMVVRK